MTPHKDFAALDRWLRKLECDVRRLQIDEVIFWEIQRIVRRNKRLHVTNDFFAWMGRMYVAGMSMAIRRQLDTDTRTRSFLRFLLRIKGDPGVVSRRQYKSLFPVKECNYADRCYDKLVGKTRQQPLPSQIDRQIQTLKRRSENLVGYATKVVAHADLTPPGSRPRYREVGEVIKYLARLKQRYVQLFRATHVPREVRMSPAWETIFLIPWIK